MNEFGDEYENRKDKTTINSQMTFDTNEKFTNVVTQRPWSLSVWWANFNLTNAQERVIIERIFGQSRHFPILSNQNI